MREFPDEPDIPAGASSVQVAGRRPADRKAGIEMAAVKRNGSTTRALAAVLVLSTLTALAACSVQRPGTAEDHSLDAVEQNRAAMGVAPADSSYEQAERNRMTVGTHVDTSYDDIERSRAGRVGP
jgi:hypothetical protein